MGFDLKTLLLDEQMEQPTFGLLIPEVNLNAGTVYERLYGMAGDKSSKKFWNGRTQYQAKHSRSYVVFGKGISQGAWTPCLTIGGAGFLSNLYGLDDDYSYRITIDGGQELILQNLSSRTRGLLWGDHHTGKSNKHPSGYFFYDGFDEFTDQYIVNFIKGAVRFQDQLRVEFRKDSANVNDKSYLSFDYLMDGEL